MTRAVLVLALLAACDQTDQERTDVACSALCGCEAPPLPALQDECMAECRQNVDAARVSDECLACVSGNADRCATLEQVCAPVCEDPQPGFPDAGVPF